MFRYIFIGSSKLKIILITLWVFFLGVYVMAISLFLQFFHDSAIGQQREVWWIWIRGVYLVFAIIGALVFLYAWRIEPRWLEVRRVKLTFKNISGLGKEPLRIVHLSDFHCEATIRNEMKIPEIVANLEPDVVLYTGDALNSPKGLGIFQSIMRSVSQIATTFAVRGNWDEHYWKDIDLFHGTSVRELSKGKNETLDIRGAKVHIGGLLYGETFGKNAVFPSTSDRELRILLCHRPQIFDDLSEAACHLVCVGHTHGGQVRLPGTGPLFTFSPDTRRYVSGVFLKNDMIMHVSRGIGMEGGLAPRIRLLARPEITLFLLSSDDF